jgi:hypothetical protein
MVLGILVALRIALARLYAVMASKSEFLFCFTDSMLIYM